MLFDRLLPALRAVRQQLRKGDSRVAELGIGGDGSTIDVDGAFHVLERTRQEPSQLVQGRRDAQEIRLRDAHPRSW